LEQTVDPVLETEMQDWVMHASIVFPSSNAWRWSLPVTWAFVDGNRGNHRRADRNRQGTHVHARQKLRQYLPTLAAVSAN